MTKQALKALKSSIAHWKRLVSGKRKEGEGISGKHCALCEVFFNLRNPPFCKGCPVKDRTNKTGCRGTPYNLASLASVNGLDSPEFKAAAKKELEFLRSLLPKRRAQQ